MQIKNESETHSDDSEGEKSFQCDYCDFVCLVVMWLSL